MVDRSHICISHSHSSMLISCFCKLPLMWLVNRFCTKYIFSFKMVVTNSIRPVPVIKVISQWSTPCQWSTHWDELIAVCVAGTAKSSKSYLPQAQLKRWTRYVMTCTCLKETHSVLVSYVILLTTLTSICISFYSPLLLDHCFHCERGCFLLLP